MRQAFQYRTGSSLAASTPLHRGDQLGFHPLKVRELLVNLGKVLACEGVDFDTRQVRALR